jgi:hypothetical protein
LSGSFREWEEYGVPDPAAKVARRTMNVVGVDTGASKIAAGVVSPIRKAHSPLYFYLGDFVIACRLHVHFPRGTNTPNLYLLQIAF